MGDFVDIGFCTFDCRAVEDDSDNETTSLPGNNIRGFPGRRKVQSLTSAVNDDYEPARRKAALVQRLEKFQAKGWLSQQEHKKFSSFLSTFDSNAQIGESGSYALKELEVELNLMENQMKNKKSVWKKMLTPTKSIQGGRPPFCVTSRTPPTTFPNSPRVALPLGNATSKYSNGGAPNQPSIVVPSSLSRSLSDDAIANLFTDTCFFARLGFIQPPCCMQCTYREAMKSASPRLQCKRWVIWRKNANSPLHPSNVCENVIAIQCQTARKLTAGETIESVKWDRHKKLLVFSGNISSLRART